jgi:hypothetical protein
VLLDGSGTATIRVTNSGNRPAVVDVRRAGFALDLRGRPKIVPTARSSAQSWISARPASLVVGARQSTTITVTANVPHRAEPGDHQALVLLTTRPRGHTTVAVRLRLGVVVAVRAPGRIVHALALRRLGVRRTRVLRMLDLVVANRGNVTERLDRDRMSVVLLRSGRVIARLHPESRDVLPRSRGFALFRYRGRVRGKVTVLAMLRHARDGRTVSRTYRLRL